jgi:anti-anti-sigma factor
MSEPDGLLDIAVEGEGEGPITVTVAGEVDYETSGELRAAVNGVLERAPGTRLHFDLTGVDFLDSSGLAVLIEAENRGAEVRVTGASAPVRLTIRATGLQHLVDPS